MTPAERIAELEEEVAWLKSELGIADEAGAIDAYCSRLGLRPQCGRLMRILAGAYPKVVSRATILDALPVRNRDEAGTKCVDVLVCQTRRKIGREAIRTAWGFGFALTAAGREIVRDAIQ